MGVFFDLVSENKIKIRIMFTSNKNKVARLSSDHKRNEYFLLYYQFFKHAFGLSFCNRSGDITRLRINFDYLPDTTEKRNQFKDYVYRLQNQPEFQKSRIVFEKGHIAEVDSKKHLILQCLDVALGATAFRLNHKHKVIPRGKSRIGKKTIAKEKLYKFINKKICATRDNFNIGITTGLDGSLENLWMQPYRHWLFKPRNSVIDENQTKRKSS